MMYKEKVIDDDLTIIDAKPEIIALSSDDEDEVRFFYIYLCTYRSDQR